ncbi:MAG: YARHG domain-containing protein [Candidatus Berkelbacteria bacterium]|nr:YARHG domain-containing protein [Candidatus Berkelbacteria bacterium]
MESKPQEKSQPVQSQPTQSAPAQSSPTASQPQVPQKSSKVGLIIVIIVLVLLVLGVGGYFGVKYGLKKFFNKATSALITTTTTATTSSGKASVKTVIDALMYPGATIADQKQGEDMAYKAELTLNSADSVATIKAYYTKLVADKSWKITRQGSSGDNNYYFTVTDGVFEAEIDATKYDGYDFTDIGIKISGESLVADGILVSPTTAQSSSASTTTATTTSATSASSSDYIISDSSSRVISESELTNLTPWKLKVARNEIYARHGREFVHKDLQCYFAKKSWYRVDSGYSASSLSSTENKNVATIQAYEEKTSSPLASSDSGCDTNQ